MVGIFFEELWNALLSSVERRDVGIRDGRLGVVLVPAFETGRGIWEGDLV